MLRMLVMVVLVDVGMGSIASVMTRDFLGHCGHQQQQHLPLRRGERAEGDQSTRADP